MSSFVYLPNLFYGYLFTCWLILKMSEPLNHLAGLKAQI